MASKSSRSRIIFILMSIFFRVIVNTKIQPLASDISLIYEEYYNHKLYCTFATMEVIQKSEGLVERVCVEKFKDMYQTLPNGTVTYPYLKYSDVGYVPSCEKLKIANGLVGICNPGLKILLVHTVCNYSCDPGFIATSPTVTCRLMGSQKNVSVQWWKDKDFFDPENMEPGYCKQLSIQNGRLGVCLKDSKNERMLCNYSCDPGFLATNSNSNFHLELGNNHSFQRIKDEVLCVSREPAFEQLVQESKNYTTPLAVLTSSVFVVIAIVIIALPCTRRKVKAIICESPVLVQENHDTHNGNPWLGSDVMPVENEQSENQPEEDSSPEEHDRLLQAKTVVVVSKNSDPATGNTSAMVTMSETAAYGSVQQQLDEVAATSSDYRKQQVQVQRVRKPQVQETRVQEQRVQEQRVQEQRLQEQRVQDRLQETASPIQDSTMPAGHNDNRHSGTNSAYPEVPDEHKEIQSFNQNMAGCKAVGTKKIPGCELQQLMAVLGESSLKDDLISGATDGSLPENHQCTTDVRFLLDNTASRYRLKLLGELEIIDNRRRDQALVGYVVKNREALGFPSENSIKLQEETFRNKVDEKVSEYFLRGMSFHGHTIGMMLDYFAEVGATNVLDVVLEVHKGCPFCEKFRT